MAMYMAEPMPSASEAALQRRSITYTAPGVDLNPPSVVLSETQSILASSGTTGFRTWEAALHLASFLYSSDGRNLVAQKHVLELGAGTGLLSIFCAAHLGASYVLATDGSTEIINNLKKNLVLNDLGSSETLGVQRLQWGHALIGGAADRREEGKRFDTILGADLVCIPTSLATKRVQMNSTDRVTDVRRSFHARFGRYHARTL